MGVAVHADLFAHMLIGYALLLIRMIRWIAEHPFAPSYWAFTFGATALAGASVRSLADPDGLFSVLALVLFILANIVVLGVAAGTVRQWLVPVPVQQ